MRLGLFVGMVTATVARRPPYECLTIASSEPAVSTDTASVSRAIHSECSRRSRSVSGRRERDAIGQREPRFLPHGVDPVDEVVDPALAPELVVQPRVERDRHAVGGRDRPAFLATPLDQHLLRAQVVPRRSEAAAGKLLELSGFECLAHRDQLSAELRAEQA